MTREREEIRALKEEVTRIMTNANLRITAIIGRFAQREADKASPFEDGEEETQPTNVTPT